MIEIWTLIIDAFDKMYQAFSTKKKVSSERREQLYKENIEYSFINLELIHKDYSNSFSTLLRNIREKKDPVETIEIFKFNSLNLLTDRREIRSLGEEIIKLQKQKYLNSVELELFCDYARAIDNFFQAVGMGSNVSWYSAFINEFEDDFRKGFDPFKKDEFKTIGGDFNCLEHVERKTEEVLFNHLPKSWENVCSSYNKLKLSLR